MFITQNQVDLRYIRIEVSIQNKYTCTRGTKFNNICSEVDDHSEGGGVEEGAQVRRWGTTATWTLLG